MPQPADDHIAVHRLRVHFIHGLEGSPRGHKAMFLAEHFDSVTPTMDTRDFAACVQLHAELLNRRTPDVLVGSSFGGAVALALLQRGEYRGPTLLLAPAATKLGLPPRVPTDVPVLIVHGRQDEIIDLADSHALCRAGDPRWVRMVEVEDSHGLSSLVSSGRLTDLVRDVYTLGSGQRRIIEPG